MTPSLVFAFVIGLFLLPGGDPASAADASQINHPAPKLPLQQQVDQKQVDAAIEKGVAFLRAEALRTRIFDAGPKEYKKWYDELVLLTLLHAGESIIKRKDPMIQKLTAKSLARPMVRTYNVSLMAMCLQEIDIRKHRSRLKTCAQWLADAQCQNGQWTYGIDLTKPETATPTWNRTNSVSTGTDSRSISRIPKRFKGAKSGDNSNSQYAALGIRACHDAGMRFPDQVILKAKEWWEESQHQDGAWGYSSTWANNSYSSMTCGAVASLSIYHALLGELPRNQKSIKRGLTWIGNHFDPSKNVGARTIDGEDWQQVAFMYDLYAAERAGVLSGTDRFGNHHWYPKGATWLLTQQTPEGYWPRDYGKATATCFAILFLRCATRPIVTGYVTPNRREEKDKEGEK